MKRYITILILAITTIATADRKSDSLALVSISQSNTDNYLDWDFTQPINSWQGVILNGDRVDSLDLSQKNLTSIPSSVNSLTELTRLNISGNQIELLPEEIGDLMGLKNLNISKNRITSIPTSIGNIKGLYSLYAYQNDITALPPQLFQLTNLLILDLHMNELDSISPEISVFGRLFSLNLSYNNLTSIPAEIGYLGNLKSLRLQSNPLETIPAELGNCASLEQLALQSTRLTYIPEELGNLENLQWLDLSSNFLQSLPSSIGNLKSLTDFFLFYNDLESLPDELYQLSSITGLWIYGNELDFHTLENCADRWPNLYYFRYDPQSPYVPTIISADSSLLFVQCKGVNNTYQWYEKAVSSYIDDKMVDGAISDTLHLTDGLQEPNRYYCQVTNDRFPEVSYNSNTVVIGEDALPIANNPISRINTPTIDFNNNRLHIQNASDIQMVNVVSLNGRLVKSTNVNNIGSITIEINNLSSSVYLLTLISKYNNTFTHKIMIR